MRVTYGGRRDLSSGYTVKPAVWHRRVPDTTSLTENND